LLAADLPCVLGRADFEAQNLRGASPPALAPVDSSAAFLAASLWPAAHSARWEALHGDTPVSLCAVRAQAAERLRRANA